MPTLGPAKTPTRVEERDKAERLYDTVIRFQIEAGNPENFAEINEIMMAILRELSSASNKIVFGPYGGPNEYGKFDIMRFRAIIPESFKTGKNKEVRAIQGLEKIVRGMIGTLGIYSVIVSKKEYTNGRTSTYEYLSNVKVGDIED